VSTGLLIRSPYPGFHHVGRSSPTLNDHSSFWLCPLLVASFLSRRTVIDPKLTVGWPLAIFPLFPKALY
jgi:hypothetical protein